jgi:hypothetical protein
MGFGRNPHVAKAEAAEAKAQEAKDVASEVRAWLEAAHLWERAASKEVEGKRHAQYEANAQSARERSASPSSQQSQPLDTVVARLKLVQPPPTTLH